MIPALVIERELGKTIKIVDGLGPGVAGRYEVNIDDDTLLADADGVISTAFSLVFTDSEDLETANFSSSHTPFSPDPDLAAKKHKIYRTPSGSAYIYDPDQAAYLPLGQIAIREWHTSGVTSPVTLPYVSTSGRIAFFINGVYYDETNYSLAGVVLDWNGSFDIEPSDSLKVFFI